MVNFRDSLKVTWPVYQPVTSLFISQLHLPCYDGLCHWLDWWFSKCGLQIPGGSQDVFQGDGLWPQNYSPILILLLNFPHYVDISNGAKASVGYAAGAQAQNEGSGPKVH